ncbi:surfeit locus protein 4-like isoform X1 [Branchiostoma lanceolatum]|uniref:surfeit locus protein 4-like isoform X1 n=1 Tax=Branchiostoma lanceolatum TaxID=7740 RepID=UPI003455BAD1
MERQNELLSKAEDVADQILRHSKHVLPHIARLCLISTFLEDGIRMWFQWNEQRDYIEATWGCGYFLASLFVFINLVGQVGGCVMILSRQKVQWACGLLSSIIALQVFMYNLFTEFDYIFRQLALAGAIILLLAECFAETKPILAGVPTAEDDDMKKPKTYLQLVGRITVPLMFLPLVHFGGGYFQILLNLVGFALMVLVMIGYKTKHAAVVLCLQLFVLNVYLHPWWMHRWGSAMQDYLKYDFFQTLSVIGGVLMVVVMGPGTLSLDERKKFE